MSCWSAAAQGGRIRDGIPDAWRKEHFGGSRWTARAAATADPDRDGANNYLEYITGTDPQDRRSFDRSPAYVTTWAGSVQGHRDGFRTGALLFAPRDMAFDRFGNLWFTENGDPYYHHDSSHRIRIVSPFGFVSTISGSAEPGSEDGHVSRARYYFPQTPVFDSRGNTFIADIYNHRVRKIDRYGVVSTFAGWDVGYRNGRGTNAQFHTVQSLCVDRQDNLYVADWDNICIRKITPDGEVSLFAGIPGVRGATDGHRLEATFETPGHMAFAPNGDMFVVDWANGLLRVINRRGIVSTFASDLAYTHRVIIDDESNVYVTWGIPGPITALRKYRPDGRVAWTVGGTAGSVGLEDGPIATAKFTYAFSPVLLSNGNILISDLHNHRIRQIHMIRTRLLQVAAQSAENSGYLITITTPAEQAEIRYTTDRSEPTVRSLLYTEPVVISGSSIVRARLFVGDNPVSDIERVSLATKSVLMD
jgi:hypothetical protein